MRTGYYSRLLQKGFLKDEDLEPDIGPLSYYIECFSELSSCRVSGMALGPIPFTAVVEYARAFEVENFIEFHWIIRKMDNAMLALEAKKGKPNVSNNPGPTNHRKV